MIQMPAFCRNCGNIFPSGITCENSKNITFNNCTSRCPVCGSIADVPSGVFNFIGDTIEILRAPDITITQLTKFSEILKKARFNNEEADTIKKEIEREVPELEGLAKMLPQNKKELISYLTFIFEIIRFIIELNIKEPTNTYNAEQIINNYYNTNIIQMQSDEGINNFTDQETSCTLVRSKPKIGRNDSCPCGSGIKYKKCCGKSENSNTIYVKIK